MGTHCLVRKEVVGSLCVGSALASPRGPSAREEAPIIPAVTPLPAGCVGRGHVCLPHGTPSLCALVGAVAQCMWLWPLVTVASPILGHLFPSNRYLLELQFLPVELARIEGTDTAHFWGDRDGPVRHVEAHVPHSWADRKAGTCGRPPSARGLRTTGSAA